MTYTDDKGVSNSIHMPAKTFKKATEHFLARNYAELAKFPAWGKFFNSRCSLALSRPWPAYALMLT